MIRIIKQFVHRSVVSQEHNQFRPYVLRKRALIVYGILTLFTFVMMTPIRDIQLEGFLATITQDLVISYTNPDREIQGLLPLSVHPKLKEAAQAKADDMVARNYFSHNGPDGERPWVWLDQAEYRYAAAGENLAIDFSDPLTLVQAWLDSPLHAKNIRNGYFTDVGIGIAHGEIDGRDTTVVAMFLGREITPTLETVMNEPLVPLLPIEPSPPLESGGPPPASEPSIAVLEPILVTPQKEFEKAIPEEPVVVKVVEEEDLDKETRIIFARAEQETPSLEEPKVAGVQYAQQGLLSRFNAFMIQNAPHVLRAYLSVIFLMLIVHTLLVVASRHRRYQFMGTRLFLLSVFTLILWIPEFYT